MKKTAKLLMAAVLSLLLVSCGTKLPAPSEAVTAALDEMKAKTAEDFAKEVLDEAGLPDIGEGGNAEELFDKLMDFDYEVTGETVAEDKQSATVDVRITTYPFGTAFADLFGNLFSLAVSGEIDVNDEAAVTGYVLQELGSVTEKNYTSTVTVSCTRDGDGWEPDLDSDEFTDALLGGMYTVVNALNSEIEE